MIDKLKKIFGPKCTAINIDGEITEFINVPSKPLKFCEAVKYSFNIPLRLINNNLSCPGARPGDGFNKNDKYLVRILSRNDNIPVSFITTALNLKPTLHDGHHINMGLTEYMEKEIKTDLYILYIKRRLVTAVMQDLEKYKITPSIPPYSLLSVCGNVFSNCYVNQLLSISFGCPDSRKHGDIEKDEVVLGLSYKFAKLIIDTKFGKTG